MAINRVTTSQMKSTAGVTREQIEEDELKARFGLVLSKETPVTERDKLREEYDKIFNEWKQIWELKKDTFKPTLYEVISFMTTIIKNEDASVGATFILFVLTKIPTLITGQSGSGKTQIMSAVKLTIMPGDIYQVDSTSETALFRDHIQFNAAKYLEIPEVNKLGQNSAVTELLKSGGEGKSITRRATNMSAGTVDNFVLQPKPYIWSLADESAAAHRLGEELKSRGVSIQTNQSREQTKTVLIHKAQRYMDSGYKVSVDQMYAMCIQYYIAHLPTVGVMTKPDEFDYDIFNPGAVCFVDLLPTFFKTVTRDFEKYVNGMNSITRFYHYDRIKYKNERGYCSLVCAPKDMFLAYYIFGKQLIESARRVSQDQEVMLKWFNSMPGTDKAKVREILINKGFAMSDDVLKQKLKELVDYGYLIDGGTPQNRTYVVSKLYQETKQRPDFKLICEQIFEAVRIESEQYDIPELYEEYMARYGNDFSVENPLTGEMIEDFREYDFSESAEDRRFEEQLKQMIAENQAYQDSVKPSNGEKKPIQKKTRKTNTLNEF